MAVNDAKVHGYVPISAPPVAGSPYSGVGGPVPPGDYAGPAGDLLNDGPSSLEHFAQKRVWFEVDWTDIATVGAHFIGPQLPENAVIVRSFYCVTDAFLGGAGAEIGIGFDTDAANGIKASAVLGGEYAAGWHEGLQVGTTATFAPIGGLTADRQVEFNTTVNPLTAGHMVLCLDYIVLP